MKTGVFYNEQNVAEVGTEWYEKLKHHAFEADQKRARLCLHKSPDDLLHEMLIVFHRDTLIRPHRHTGKTESYHMVFGELDIVLFSDDGRPIRLLPMGTLASGKTHVYRLNAPIWHSVIVRSEYAAIHEVTNGPFKLEENEFAPWAPEEPNALRGFLDRSAEAAADLR